MRPGRLRVGAAAAGAALAVAAAGCGQAAPSSPPTTRSLGTSPTVTTVRPSRPAVSVDLGATPAGWTPVDYGDAQVSVPPTWTVAYTSVSCISAQQVGPGIVVLPSAQAGTCHGPALTHGPLVDVGVLAAGARAPAGATALVVHGIAGWAAGAGCLHGVMAPCAYSFPPVGITVAVTPGAEARLALEAHGVVESLTHSPRAVALAPGPAPTVPASWRRVSYGGIGLRVPGSWPTVRVSRYGGGCSILDQVTLGVSPQVTLNSGTSTNELLCIAFPPAFAAAGEAAGDGVLIDPGPYRPSSASFGACVDLNGLAVCPATDAPYGILTLAVHVPSSTTTVAVQIGLAGDGTTARTILHSIGPAG